MCMPCQCKDLFQCTKIFYIHLDLLWKLMNNSNMLEGWLYLLKFWTSRLIFNMCIPCGKIFTYKPKYIILAYFWKWKYNTSMYLYCELHMLRGRFVYHNHILLSYEITSGSVIQGCVLKFDKPQVITKKNGKKIIKVSYDKFNHAAVLLNLLLNFLWKRDKMLGCQAIYPFFAKSLINSIMY